MTIFKEKALKIRFSRKPNYHGPVSKFQRLPHSADTK
jgi:hypothetical protein